MDEYDRKLADVMLDSMLNYPQLAGRVTPEMRNHCVGVLTELVDAELDEIESYADQWIEENTNQERE